MTTIRTRIATLVDLEVVASLFDAYRQFYQQQPDLVLARHFIEARLRNDESLAWVRDEVFYTYSRSIGA